MTSNLAVILKKVNDLRLENIPVPKPKENEVLLKMGCVGICGSDVHYLLKGKIADFVVKEPMIMGHEASGTVVQLGSNVKNLKIGDRVAIEPGVPCRVCSFCKEGKYNLCPDIIFCATPPCHGNLSQYYCHAADFCYKLPANVSLMEGALLEPLSVGVHACRRAGVGLGQTVLILGAGPIGLVTTLVAKSMGAAKIIVIDLLQGRLDTAKSCGAHHVLKISPTDSTSKISEQIKNILGDLPEKTIDCTGHESTVQLGIESTRSGGTFVLVGMASEKVNIPLVSASIREIDIRGVFRYCNDYQLALSMVASGEVNVMQLITHNFSLEESQKAFDTAAKGIGNPIKIMIHCESTTMK